VEINITILKLVFQVGSLTHEKEQEKGDPP
jgi:hypothetical protein